MSLLSRLGNWFKKSEAQDAGEARGFSGEKPTSVVVGSGPGYMGVQADGSLRGLGSFLNVDQDLMRRYADYENMDDVPELSAVLDIYADDSTTPDTVRGRSIWAVSKDKVYRDIADDLLRRRLRIENDIWGVSRALCKYGNAFAEIVLDENGVQSLNYLPPPTMRRVEDARGNLVGFVQDPRMAFSLSAEQFAAYMKDEKGREKLSQETGLVIFYPWEVVHWRIRSKFISPVYGYGVLDSVRGTWKRLCLLEDSALIYKLTRSPGRYAFYVDTADLPPHQAIAYVDQVRRRYKKKKVIDQSTGQIEFRNNVLSPDDDFWVPTRGGRESTRIETVSGPDWQSMEDIQYFREKMVSGTKVPKAYLGLGDAEPTKASLANEDVRFARTAMRIQREIRNGFHKVGRVHFATLNIDPDVVDWNYEMTVPSSIFELAQIEVLNARADLAGSMNDYLPREVIMERILKFSKQEAVFFTSEKDDEDIAALVREAEAQEKIKRIYGPEVAGLVGAAEGGDGGDVSESVDKRLDMIMESQKNGERMTSRALRSLDATQKALLEVRRQSKVALK